MTFGQINQGSGELELYPDITKGIDQETVEYADKMEKYIIYMLGTIRTGSLNVGHALVMFRDNEYYRARGYDTFDAWADSPELGLGRQTAKYLMRIVENIVPVLENEGLDPDEYPTSTLRAMLPLLTEEDAENKILEAAYAVKDLTTKDANAIIREMRGVDNTEPAIVKAYVTMGDSTHKINAMLWRPDGTFVKLGTWYVPVEDYARVEQLFGRHVEVE